MGIKSVSSKISDGNMSFKYGSQTKVTQNRQIFLQNNKLFLPTTHSIRLEHGSKIIPTSNKTCLSASEDFNLPVADGIYTTNKKEALMVLTADCVPITLFSLDPYQLLLLHAGWKSLDLQLLVKGLKKLAQKASRSGIKVIIGPHIMRSSYIVDEAVQANKTSWQGAIVELYANKYAIDLQKYIYNQATKFGVPPDHIELNIIDTYTHPDYFSYRQLQETDSTQGRFATVAFFEG